MMGTGTNFATGVQAARLTFTLYPTPKVFQLTWGKGRKKDPVDRIEGNFHIQAETAYSIEGKCDFKPLRDGGNIYAEISRAVNLEMRGWGQVELEVDWWETELSTKRRRGGVQIHTW